MKTEFTQADKRLLLVHFAVDEEFQRRVKSVPPGTVEGWHPIQELPYRVLWRAIDGVLDKSGASGPISSETLLATVSGDPDAASILNSSNVLARKELDELLLSIKEHDIARAQQHSQVALDILQRFLDIRVALAETNKFEGETLSEQADFLMQRLAAYRPSTLEPDEFMSPDAPLPDVRFFRLPFGIRWLDDLTGGGMEAGDLMLFVAPSGGGKTVFGTQLAWARAQQLQHACYLTYEQPIKGDIMIRFLAMATGLPKSTFEGRDINELPANVREAVNDARCLYGQYIHPCDMSGSSAGSGGVPEIRDLITSQTRKNQRPSLVIVDWVQTAVANYMAAQNMRDDQLTMQMDRFAKEFAKLCREEEIQGVMLQQMDNANQTKRGIEPHHTLAARCKSMGNYCRYALGIARLSDEGFGRMVLTKATTGSLEDNSRIVRLHGPLNRFEEVDRRVVFDPRSGQFVRQADRPMTAPPESPGTPQSEAMIGANEITGIGKPR